MTEILTISEPVSLYLIRIPAGEFQMGSVKSRDKDAQEDELPQHPVYIPEFCIGRYPVTNDQYQAFVQATGHGAPDHWKDGRMPHDKQNHPVVNVSWRNAVAFCDWLSRETKQPFRLPTEAEWEKAARGTDGRIYPWGDDPPDKDRCNFNNNVGTTTSVGQYSPHGDSPYGCADMAGNVWEHCQNLYKPYPYQADDGREDHKGTGLGLFRGGTWYTESARVRCAFRNLIGPDDGYYGFGFRVARGPLG